MQDTNPMPWGALDRYQAHFIVRVNEHMTNLFEGSGFVARTKLRTKGHFAAKTVTGVIWDGSECDLLDKLNNDTELNERIARQTVHNASIYIEQTNKAIRIRNGGWSDNDSFEISKELFDIYNTIAGHIRSN